MADDKQPQSMFGIPIVYTKIEGAAESDPRFMSWDEWEERKRREAEKAEGDAT